MPQGVHPGHELLSLKARSRPSMLGETRDHDRRDGAEVSGGPPCHVKREPAGLYGDTCDGKYRSHDVLSIGVVKIPPSRVTARLLVLDFSMGYDRNLRVQFLLGVEGVHR
jgi:hypothetical protein